MREEEEDEQEGGRFAVPGEESHESKATLSPDDGGEDDPHEPPSEPKQPSPRR